MYYDTNLSSFLYGYKNEVLAGLEEFTAFQEIKRIKIELFSDDSTKDRYLHFVRHCNYFSTSQTGKEMTMQDFIANYKENTCTICGISSLGENLSLLLSLAEKINITKRVYYPDKTGMNLIKNMQYLLAEFTKLDSCFIKQTSGDFAPLLIALKEEAKCKFIARLEETIKAYTFTDVHSAFLRRMCIVLFCVRTLYKKQ